MVAIRRILILILILRTDLALYSQDSLDRFFLYRVEFDSSLMDIQYDSKSDAIYRFFSDKVVRFQNSNSKFDTFYTSLNTKYENIDYTFPLKKMIYSCKSNLIKVLNSKWSEVNQLNLNVCNISNPSFVNYGNDESIFILDQNTNELIRINENGSIKYRSVNPFRIHNNFYFPNKLIDLKEYLLALDTIYGVFAIDHYGTMLWNLKIENISRFIEIDSKLYFQANNYIYSLNYNKKGGLIGGKKQLIQSEFKSILPFSRDKLYLMDEKLYIKVYSNFLKELN